VFTSESLRIGIGDDAAVLDLGATSKLVVTSDLLAEGVHFEAGTALPRVGHKALAVNLSDLAAMSARPLAAVVSLLLSDDTALQSAKAVVEGMQPLATRHQVAIAGGDTNSWSGRLVISVTALGCLAGRSPWTRNGAVPGDVILVTGSLGGSLGGKHLDFEPRVTEALRLAGDYEIHAAIDISDGLSLDLARMATASGCAAVLDLEAIPISDAARSLAPAPESKSALDRALSDGEDFELLLAVPREVAKTLKRAPPFELPLTEIGEFASGAGIWRRKPDGGRAALEVEGYEHL
jgi:thiamine-monophosphate kinase